MQSHIHRVHACLTVTSHLHFRQNDQNFLRATAVTWGWNGYRNKSQHRKLMPEKKILSQLLLGLEPATFSITSPALQQLSYPCSQICTMWWESPLHSTQYIRHSAAYSERHHSTANNNTSYIYNPQCTAHGNTSYIYNPQCTAHGNTSYIYNPQCTAHNNTSYNLQPTAYST